MSHPCMGVCMALPWVFHVHVDLPWVCHGSPLGLPWVIHGSPPRVTHESVMCSVLANGSLTGLSLC